MENLDGRTLPKACDPAVIPDDSVDDNFVNFKKHTSVLPEPSAGTSVSLSANSTTNNRLPLVTVLSKNQDDTKGSLKSKPAIIIRKDEPARFIRVGEKGKIHYLSHPVLGRGATSTVYRGYYEDKTRPAAVKLLDKDLVDIFEKEIDILRKVDSHVNVVRYFSSEDFNSQYYIAMELGMFTLEQCVDKTLKGFVQTSVEKIQKYVVDACKGLKWLHQKKILHRDIKPANIVIFQDVILEEYSVAKLVDFGVSRKLSSMTVGTNSLGKGTADWMCPEAFLAMEEARAFQTTPGVDVFSLGATMFFSLSGGIHPFGSTFRQKYNNLVENPPDWQHIKDEIALINLLKQMMDKDPKRRPSMAIVLEHPYFWDGKTQLDFINTVSNALNLNSTKWDWRGSLTLKEMEAVRDKIDNHMNTSFRIENWHDKLCSKVQCLLHFKKKYTGDSVMKLVEFIRDKYQHSSEWVDSLKDDDVFGQSEESYMIYFSSRFPALIPVLYTVLQNSNLDKLKSLKSKFFQTNVNSAFQLATANNQ